MFGPRAARALLAFASLAKIAHSELITITEYPSTCSAIYTSGSQTVTVIQSTVTVVPQPFDDAANSGTPFIIAVQMLNPEGYMTKRQAETPSWVMWNGNTTVTRSVAGTYKIMDGQLMSTNGSFVSTFRNVLAQAFDIRDGEASVNTTFSIRGGLLHWENPLFTNNTAEFYKLPPGLLDNAQILVRFIGADDEPERGWSPIYLSVEPVDLGAPGISYPGGSPTTSVGSVIVSNGNTITPPVNPPVYTPPVMSTMLNGMTMPVSSAMPMSSSSTGGNIGIPIEYTSPIGQPSIYTPPVDPPVYSTPILGPGGIQSSTDGSTQPTSYPGSTISPNGLCGGDTGYMCMGSGFGDCCSLYGYCGSDAGFCDPAQGCQTDFGTCQSPPPGTIASEGPDQYTQPPVTFSLSSSMMMPGMPDMTTSTAAAGPSATPAFTCPDNDGEVVSANGVSYELSCSSDTTTVSYTTSRAAGSFNDCFSICDNDPRCTGFTYRGGTDGQGEGVCFLKSGDDVEATEGSDDSVGGVRTDPRPEETTSAALPIYTTPSGAPIGPVDPTVGPPATATSVPDLDCPASDRQTYTDGNGIVYRILCRTDSEPGSYSSVPASSFGSCINACDASPGCIAVTYAGGTCYLKNSVLTLVNGGANTAILESYYQDSGLVPPNSGGNGGGVQSPVDVPTSTPAVNVPTTTPETPAPGQGSVSPNGVCGNQGIGGTPDGYTCEGSVFGECCSFSGYCGNTTDYCGAGCQSDFGDCTPGIGIIISIGGRCNEDNLNQTCAGSLFGDCCSSDGYCGRTDEYCAPGNCDPLYGECDGGDFDTSTMMSMPMSTPPVYASTSAPTAVDPLPTESTPVTQPGAQTTFDCPANDGQTVTDPYGVLYIINCQADTSGGSYAGLAANITWNECFQLCHDVPSAGGAGSCTAFTFVGANYGRGGGQCYLKNSATVTFDPKPDNFDLLAAIKLANYDGATPSAPASTSTPPIAVDPPVYQTTTTPATDPTTPTDTPTTPEDPDTEDPDTEDPDTEDPDTEDPDTEDPEDPEDPDTTPEDPDTTTPDDPSPSSSQPATDEPPPYILVNAQRCEFPGEDPTVRQDDSFCEAETGLQIRIYGATGTKIYGSTNGFLSILDGGSQYQAQQLPTTDIPPNSWVPFWDDLAVYVDVDPDQGIFFLVEGTKVTFEYYVSRSSDPYAIFQFTVAYDTAVPGVVVYHYYQTGASTDNGLYASVGIQGDDASGVGLSVQYSWQSSNIVAGLIVSCDTNANTCTKISE